MATRVARLLVRWLVALFAAWLLHYRVLDAAIVAAVIVTAWYVGSGLIALAESTFREDEEERDG